MNLIDPPGGKPWALLGLCGASVLLNVVLLGVIALGGDDRQDLDTTPSTLSVTTPDASPAVAELGEEPAASDIDAPDLDEPDGPEADAPAGAEGATTGNVVRANVERNLAYTFQNATPAHGDVLNQVYARLFFWDLDLRRDLQANDAVAVVYDWDGELAHIQSAVYTSSKLGKTLTAYRFKAAGDVYPSYWSADGVEVARRLQGGPLDDYEQVTSLLADRPTHKGMDFKVPIGAAVKAPRAGKVTRTDWNFKYNGNCVEVEYADGTLARFLHLSETTARSGQHVHPGEVLGKSGNTGRSTAPHLHYELERKGKVIDPVKYHGTRQVQLSPSERAAFDAVRRRADVSLGLSG